MAQYPWYGNPLEQKPGAGTGTGSTFVYSKFRHKAEFLDTEMTFPGALFAHFCAVLDNCHKKSCSDLTSIGAVVGS